MRLEMDVEKTLGFPDGIDELLNESQASKILQVIDKLTKAKKKSDIEAVIDMLHNMVLK